MVSVSGLGQELLDDYSTGRKRVKATEARYAEKGLSKQGKAKVQLFDRPDKLPDMPLPQRRAGWLKAMKPAHYAAVTGLVRRAKGAVALKKWGKGLESHLHKIRDLAVRQDLSQEQSRGKGRGR